MNTQTQEALKVAQEVSLIELLRSVPENARLIVDNADGMSSSSHPVGYLCHKAAEALAQPAQEVGDAEIKQMLNDIEYYQKRVEELEHPAHFGTEYMEGFNAGKMFAELEQSAQHKWSADGERCVKCGDKDWMGGACSVSDEQPAKEPPKVEPFDVWAGTKPAN